MTTAIEKLGRQRRRIVFSVLVVMLAASTAFGASLWSAAAGAAAAVLFALVILALPRQRRLCETSALGLWFATLLPLPVESLPIATAAGAALFYTFLYGSWTERAGWSLSQSSHTKVRVQQTAAEVWASLIPGESHPEDHWSGRLVDFDHDREDRDTVYLRFDNKGVVPDEMTLTFLQRDPGRSCRYFLERDGRNGYEDMTVSVTLTEPLPGMCQIETSLDQRGVPVGTALMNWFDDNYGDEIDAYAETISRRRTWAVQGKSRAEPERALA